MKSLTLNVSTQWFNDAREGRKTEEYRLANEYWTKRLFDKDGKPKEFKDIKYKLGYPSASDNNRVITFVWEGFEKKVIVHPHFDNKPVEVYAIKIRERVTNVCGYCG